MSRLGAFRVGGHRIDGVLPGGWADWKCSIGKIRPEIGLGRCVGILFLVFEGPLLFGGIDLAEVVNTGIFLGCTARFHKIGNGDSGQHADRNNRCDQKQFSRMLIAVTNGDPTLVSIG